MIEAGAPSTSELQACCPKRCARHTEGSYGLIVRDPTQRAEDAKRRAAPQDDGASAAKGIIKAGARKPRPGN